MIYHNILYQSLKNVTAEWHAGHLQWEYIWSYIKFFDDGSFIYASIQGDNLEVINKSFNKNSNNVTKGRFAINGSLLSLQFDNIDIKGYITKENYIVLEGIQTWEIFYPSNKDLIYLSTGLKYP